MPFLESSEGPDVHGQGLFYLRRLDSPSWRILSYSFPLTEPLIIRVARYSDTLAKHPYINAETRTTFSNFYE
jgi:hypothetical protein